MADLVTRNEYKDYMGITTNNKDKEIDLLIPMISQLVKTYCRRTFIDYVFDPKVEIFNGGVTEFILSETPIVDIIDFGWSSDYGQSYTPLVKYEDWVLTENSIRSIPLGNRWNEIIAGFKVEYQAGYVDGTPVDLKLAILDLIEYYSKNNTAVHVNRDITPNITQIQYIASTNFPAHIKRILDQYTADYT
jgi:hypothetical protein